MLISECTLTGYTHRLEVSRQFHVGAKQLWDMLLAALVPAVAHHPALPGWNLANDPSFRAANSSFTFVNFAAFLCETRMSYGCE